MKEVRTRFAPSPTGFLHVGSARTAFWAWLLARHSGGTFLLRVEDTDQERKVVGAVKSLLEELRWLGIEIDEGPSLAEIVKAGDDIEGLSAFGGDCGPYIQSQRLPRYKEVAEKLVDSGHAYRCDCTPEMLEKERIDQMARRELPGYSGYCRDRAVPAERPHVVRFKMPYKRQVILEDAVKGRVVWDNVSLRDSVLLKSDGYPTYHLAVVVDDHDMRISHVLRGDEWLSTAPLHILLYEALQWESPIFAHLPVIMGPNGKKLSKREGDVFSSTFRERGYLPDAVLNFTVLIGWSPGEGDEQEIFSRQELIEKFSLKRINQASGKFDYDKLAWMNGMYIRQLPPDRFLSYAKEFTEKAGMIFNPDKFQIIAPLVQERIKLLSEIGPMVEFLFVDKIERDLDAMYAKNIDATVARRVLELSAQRFAALEEFTHDSIETVLRSLAEELGLKAGPMFGVVRIAVTGKKITPPLFESLVAVGKEITLSRVRETIALL